MAFFFSITGNLKDAQCKAAHWQAPNHTTAAAPRVATVHTTPGPGRSSARACRVPNAPVPLGVQVGTDRDALAAPPLLPRLLLQAEPEAAARRGRRPARPARGHFCFNGGVLGKSAPSQPEDHAAPHPAGGARRQAPGSLGCFHRDCQCQWQVGRWWPRPTDHARRPRLKSRRGQLQTDRTARLPVHASIEALA